MAHRAELVELSQSMQMYLKSVHRLQEKKGAARVTDIAKDLQVNKASVTSALRNLGGRGLINYAPYDVITLTGAGLAVAEEIEGRYEALRDFFVSVLGIDEESADRAACDMEHHLPKAVSERMVGFIEYYETCTKTRFRWDPEASQFCVDADD